MRVRPLSPTMTTGRLHAERRRKAFSSTREEETAVDLEHHGLIVGKGSVARCVVISFRGVEMTLCAQECDFHAVIQS